MIKENAAPKKTKNKKYFRTLFNLNNITVERII
jgi:hypothetical protein